MPASPIFRFLLAAMVLLLLFTAAFEAAIRWPGQPPSAAGLAHEAAPADSVAVDGPTPEALAPPTAPGPSASPVETPMLPDRDPRPVFERGSRAARRPWVLHRYVGTVGGQPATALLRWQTPDSVSGSFYLHRRGPAYTLTQPLPPDPAERPIRRRRRGQMLVVDEQVYFGDGAGEWRLRGRPGATLIGTWRGRPGGRPQAVVLRESYAGGVRLAVQTQWVHGTYTITDDHGQVHSSVPEVKYEFLHLPDPAAVPPALRPLLSPGPATRRQRLLAGGDYDCRTSYGVTVYLNDFGLLSYEYAEECNPVAGGYDVGYRSALLDLQGGRWLAPESQLRPHYEPGLARLLARHLLHDRNYWHINRDSTWHQQLFRGLNARSDTLAAATRWLLAHAPPGAGGAVFTGAGMQVRDWRGNYIQAMPDEVFYWFIPYTELRPLVRPGTPLARMLAARGLW